MKKTLIKIFGLQLSGTNLISHALNQYFKNITVLINKEGWKHGHYIEPRITGKERHIVIATKNPSAWLVSVFNYWGPKRRLNIGPNLTNTPLKNL